MPEPTPEPVLDERAVECPESCGWDYELFRANLDAGAFDDDSLIAQWGVAHLARHILAKLDSTGDALTEALRERDEALDHERAAKEGWEWVDEFCEAMGTGTTVFNFKERFAALTEAEHRAERAEKERLKMLATLWEIRMAAERASVDDPVWVLPNVIIHLAETAMGIDRELAQALANRATDGPGGTE